jgi:hypothetical protein
VHADFRGRKRNFMNAISRAISLTLGAGIFVTMTVSNAFAGCGDLSNLQGRFNAA